MTSTKREGLTGTLNARRTVATGMNLVQHLRRGDFLAGSNLQLQCRNALHGHLEVGLMARLLGLPTGPALAPRPVMRRPARLAGLRAGGECAGRSEHCR